MEAEEEFPQWDAVDEAELAAIEASYYLSKPQPLSPAPPREDPSSSTDLPRPTARRRLPDWGSNRLKSIPLDSGESSSDSTALCHRDSHPKSSDTPAAASSSSPNIDGCWNLVPSPCYRANLKVRYPAVNFRGQIVYCRTLLEVEKATSELLEYIDAKKLTVDRVSLGFDTEWRPTFRRGAQQNKTAVLQLCVGSDLCYVMHIYHSGVPSSLQSILADNATVKVGVSIAGDATKLLRDYGVSVNGLADLRHLANVKLGGSPRMWSLAALLERITCKQLEKPSRIRMGNWEAHILSRDQLNYAATDAYACWYLHEVLSSFPDAKNFEGEESTESVQT